MKPLKSFLVLAVLLGAISVYFNACSPAETTTGKLAYQQKDWEKAEKELSKGVALDKGDAEAWYMLGYSQTELGKYKEAGVSFENAKKLSGDYDNLIINYWIDKFNAGIPDFNAGLKALGRKDSISASKSFTSAIKNFTAATYIIPDSIIAYQYMADAYSYIGKTDDALKIYAGILDKSKSKDDAIAIAKLLYKSGIKTWQTDKNFEKAIGIFSEIIKINFLPKDNIYYEGSLLNIGACNYQIAEKMAGDNKSTEEYKPYLSKAVESLEALVATSKSKDMLKDSYEILYNAYDALGQKDKAEDALTKKNAL
jgi:tetratricopeptide (TPR) repeat protein